MHIQDQNKFNKYIKTKLYRDEGRMGKSDNDFRLSIYTYDELGMDENLMSFVAATMRLFFEIYKRCP